MNKFSGGNMEAEESALQQKVSRFEQSLRASGKSLYFDAEDLEDLFHYYLDRQDFYSVEQVLHTAFGQHPKDNRFRCLQAELFMDYYCLYDDALEVLDANRELEDIYWNFLRLRVLMYLERFDDAVVQADLLVALGNEDDTFVIDVALLLANFGQVQLAYPYLVRAEALEPDNAEVLTALGQYALGQHDFRRAVEYAEQALNINPYLCEAWFLKGAVYVCEYKCEEALEALEYALAIDPDREVVWLVKAQTLLMVERYQEAEECVAYIKKVFSSRTDWVNGLNADLAYLRHDYKKASALYVKAFKSGFYTKEMAWRHIECKLGMHRWKDAVRLLEEYVKRYPDEVKACCQLADLYMSLGGSGKALGLIRKCLRRHPEDVDLYIFYSGLLILTDDFAKAYTVLRKVCRLAPDTLKAYVMRAVVAALQNDLRKMKADLEKACRIDEQAMDIFLLLYPKGKQVLEELEHTSLNDKRKKK